MYVDAEIGAGLYLILICINVSCETKLQLPKHFDHLMLADHIVRFTRPSPSVYAYWKAWERGYCRHPRFTVGQCSVVFFHPKLQCSSSFTDVGHTTRASWHLVNHNFFAHQGPWIFCVNRHLWQRTVDSTLCIDSEVFLMYGSTTVAFVSQCYWKYSPRIVKMFGIV